MSFQTCPEVEDLSQMRDRRCSTCNSIGWYYSQQMRNGIWLIQFEGLIMRGRRTSPQISWEVVFLFRTLGSGRVLNARLANATRRFLREWMTAVFVAIMRELSCVDVVQSFQSKGRREFEVLGVWSALLWKPNVF